MERLLIIEDSKSVAKLIASAVSKSLGYLCDLAESYRQAEELLAAKGRKYFLAVCDLNLPDAETGAAVDLALSHGIPAIVVTALYDEATRRRISAKPIADYIVKQHPRDLDYLVHLIGRIYKNGRLKALVADDSRSSRTLLRDLLARQRLTVFEAATGDEALAVLAEHPDMRLVLVDNDMPGRNGVEFTIEARRTRGMDEMAILAVSGSLDQSISPRFLKSGANDFIAKSAPVEEILCRVNMNLDMLDLIEQTRNLANKDHLTGLSNRRCFFEHAQDAYERAKAKGEHLAVCMIDIDHFKNINDTYGHYAGDVALKALARLLTERFGPSDLVARFGGEEFCALVRGVARSGLAGFFEFLRASAAALVIDVGVESFSFTVSVGVTNDPGESLESMINAADRLLYQAKNGGRNRVCLEIRN